MNEQIAAEIQAEQDHGRIKYGGDPNSTAKDDLNTPEQWASFIKDHNERALLYETLMQERRQHLVKVAGLAVSAIEAIDRARIRAYLVHRAQTRQPVVIQKTEKGFEMWAPHAMSGGQAAGLGTFPTMDAAMAEACKRSSGLHLEWLVQHADIAVGELFRQYQE